MKRRAPYTTHLWNECPDGCFVLVPPLIFHHLNFPQGQPHNSWGVPNDGLIKPPAPLLCFSPTISFSLVSWINRSPNRWSECKSLKKGCIREDAAILWWLCHCMIWELMLKCFTREWKQADPFDSQFSKVMFWKATRKYTQKSNGGGKKYPLREKKAKQSKNIIMSSHFPCSCLSPFCHPSGFTNPAFGFTYLVSPANPIWCRRLQGRFDTLRAPAIFSNLPHIHHCWHHGVNGGQVCSVQTVWWAWWYLVAA